MKIKQKTELHESLTSMNSLSYSIISYGIFYGIKQAAFFYKLFEFLIPNEYLRVIPSLFFGYFISRAMLNISVNLSEENKWVGVSIAAFDFLVLCVIIDVLNHQNWIDITNLLIFCAFVTYLGFWLNLVFVNQVKQKRKKAKGDEDVANSKQNLAILEDEIVNTNQQLNNLEQSLVEKEQEIEEINQKIADRTCPHCGDYRPNKKSKDAHAAVCKMNPENLK